MRSKEAEVEGTRRQLTASGESEREQASDRQRALKIQIEEMKAAHEKEVAALRDELASNGEWWRSRVDAVREEEEAVSFKTNFLFFAMQIKSSISHKNCLICL